MKKNIICFDLDNVICFTNKNFYKESKPNIEAIKKINLLYKKGFIIKIFTSRFMGRSNENISVAKKKGFKLTEEQLLSWGVKYHSLIFGKPSFDLYIDDKAIFFKKKWPQHILNYTKKIKK